MARRGLRRPELTGPEPGWTQARPACDLDVLQRIQERVLWLAMRMVHEANHVRVNPDGTKVGGHQASSASVVSILTALYFGGWLRPGDRISIKPHASPAFHAVQYVLGNLDQRYLTTLRAFGGLQAYPCRTKDPDPIDFSTGSVGLGAVAPLFAALADRYCETHFRPGADANARRRFIAVLGDAELDEGNVWEAINDEAVRGTQLGNVLWIVDLNRQSLDRVIPGIKAHEIQALFREVGWHVLEAKYGRRLRALFDKAGGVALRRRIDDMPNEEYQELVRMPAQEARERLISGAPAGVRDALGHGLAAVSDEDLPSTLGDLGGHDLADLLACLHAADAQPTAPTVLFAYTMKGWGLPIAGDPLNHSALLTQAQIEALRTQLAIAGDGEWPRFAPDSPEGRWCAAEAARLYPPGEGYAAPAVLADSAPITVASRIAAVISSQEVFGQTLADLSRVGGPLVERLVTVSPDVSVSTNLGGWVNRAGVWAEQTRAQPVHAGPRLLRWEPGPRGQHVELGISEMNLFLLLGQLGLTQELTGDLLLPVGTVYDPFVCRGLDGLIYSLYSGSKFVFAGTPAGVTLSPEGGAHQSTITPSIGIELPNLHSYEPCFARETEWCLLEGLRQCLDREHGASTYLRLSTRPIDQAPFRAVQDRLGEMELRRQVLRGGYRLWEPAPSLAGAPRVLIAASGAILPEALASAEELAEEGVAAVVLNITSAQRLHAEWRATSLAAIRSATVPEHIGHIAALLSNEQERRAPIVTVLDGASHALGFVGSIYGQRVIPLGVDSFGQSGARADLYAYTGIDSGHITNAALAGLALN
jgi:pyruvate dehydrogenase E1 component